jgi:molybdenum cofactor biosynthesis protein B
MGHEDHKAHSPKRLGFAVVTISDTRTKETDDSGKIIIDHLSEAGHEVLHHEIVKDSAASIRRLIIDLSKDADVIIANGGTGISKKDVTIESVKSLFQKELDGFGELFRLLSYQDIGSSAMMSRATAGIYGSRIIICLPGSPKAVELAMKKLVLPEVGHMVWEARR